MTFTKFIRKFHNEAVIVGEARTRRAKHFRRAEVLPAMSMETKPCSQCRQPMIVAQGQVARFHKACRDKWRRKKGT